MDPKLREALAAVGAEEAPVILSKAEAFEFAARKFDQMAATLDLTALVASLAGDLNEAARESVARMQRKIPEPAMQAAAIREAAAALRELVLEERLRAARMASNRGVG